MTPTAESKTVVNYVNEKPEAPAETEHVKYEVKEVSRSTKTVEGEVTLIKYVLAPIAKTIPGMVSIAENDEAKALDFFNSGIYSSIRTKASNELAGGSDEDRAFSRVAKALLKLPIYAGKSEDEVTALLRGNPALMALFSK